MDFIQSKHCRHSEGYVRSFAARSPHQICDRADLTLCCYYVMGKLRRVSNPRYYFSMGPSINGMAVASARAAVLCIRLGTDCNGWLEYLVGTAR